MEFFSDTDSPHHKLWLRVTNSLTLRTVTSQTIRNIDALSLTHAPVEEDDNTLSPDIQRRLGACVKAHRRITRLQLKHARNQHRLKYEKALLRKLITKQRWPCNPNYLHQRRRLTLIFSLRTSRSFEMTPRAT
jgi:hypothetical protein